MSEMDDLLDGTLDDLADLPAFEPYPVGSHKVMATFEQKEDGINGHPAIELKFKYEECLELANEEDKTPDQGALSGTIFMMDNQFGVGNFKKLAKPFQEALGFTTLREIIDGVKDVECAIMTSIRTDKKDPDDIKYYLNVKDIIVS